MILVTKNGYRMGVNDDNQLAAFLNSGWKKVEAVAESTPAVKEEAPKVAEPKQPNKPVAKRSGRPKKEQ